MADSAKWHLVKVNPMKAKKILAALEEARHEFGQTESLRQILIPVEKKLLPGKDKKVVSTVLYPGYLFVEGTFDAELDDLFISTLEKFQVKYHRPTPLSQDDTERFLRFLEVENATPAVAVHVSVQDTVEVQDGPFAGFRGSVQSINTGKQTAKIAISVFGRITTSDIQLSNLLAV